MIVAICISASLGNTPRAESDAVNRGSRIIVSGLMLGSGTSLLFDDKDSGAFNDIRSD